MRSSPLYYFLFAFVFAFASACGDDTSTGGNGGSGGSDTGGSDTGGGGSNNGGSPQGGSPQGGSPQGGSPQGGAPQGGGGSEEGGFGGVADGGGGAAQGGNGGNGGDGGMGGAGPQTPSEQIAAVLATPDGTGLTLAIDGALVTYVKPVLGQDPAGFFLQAEQAGPALFVAVDPATLSPVPAVGDELSLTVEAVATNAGLKQATAVSGLNVATSGNSIAPLVTDVTTATDLLTNLDGYAGRVISFDGEIDSAFTGAGAPQVAAKLLTTGMDDADVRFRLPETVRAQLDLQEGCLVAVDYGVMWRFNDAAQPSIVNASDIVDAICDSPTVTNAVAASGTSVQITFSRQIDPASVMANGSQFTFDNGLTASAATASGNTVTVTTSAQSNLTYTVTVAGTVEDTLGTGVGSPDTATFSGFVTPAVLQINEINANITGGCDLIELRVVSAGVATGFTLTERTGNTANDELTTAFPALTVAANDIILVHILGQGACNPGGSTNETTSKNQQPAATFTANVDTAWDLYATDNGLTNTDNVLIIRDGLGSIQDAVLLSDDATGTSAVASETAAEQARAAGQWLLANGTPAAMNFFVDDDFSANAALDLNGTATTRAGNSIVRGTADTHTKNDWSVAASTWGALNPGQ
ncbi:MAG: hypothetical protein HOW73_01640 [Polyangiaceae bacterium]|nr:hypothetical protein [Polyangiaceae bacterium]